MPSTPSVRGVRGKRRAAGPTALLVAGAFGVGAPSAGAGVPSASSLQPVVDVQSQRDLRNLIPFTSTCLREPCLPPGTAAEYPGVRMRDIDACLPRSRRVLTLRFVAPPVASAVATLRATSGGGTADRRELRLRKVAGLTGARQRYRVRLPRLTSTELGVIITVAYENTPTGGALGRRYYLRLKTRCG